MDLNSARIYYELRESHNETNYPPRQTRPPQNTKMLVQYLKDTVQFLKILQESQKATRKNPSKERYAQ